MASAVSLARALLALSRSRQTGVLHVQTERGTCRIIIAEGVIRGLESAPCPSAVEPAPRLELRRRILAAFECSTASYYFAVGVTATGAAWVEQPVATQDLVLCALRARLSHVSTERLQSAIQQGELRLTAMGKDLLHGATLWPEEAAAASLLARGATRERILLLTRRSPRAVRFLALLTLLAALANQPERQRRCALLLRKYTQLAQQVEAHVLLDVARHATPVEARRALRKLALKLHPDALGPHAPLGLQRASCEVMSALFAAERKLASGPGATTHLRT